jgi:DNA gyrase subunit A
MKLQDADSIADMNVFGKSDADSSRFALIVTGNGNGKLVTVNDFRSQSRGGNGVTCMKFRRSDMNDTVKCVCIVQKDDDCLMTTANGIMMRQNVADIPIQTRVATGVRLQKVDEGDRIISVAMIPKRDTATS